MQMIKLKYKKHPKAGRRKGTGKTKTDFMTLGGFELEAPQTYDFKIDVGTIREGTLSTQFRLKIPLSGECEIPDTQYNRDKLKAKFQLEQDGSKYYIFDILSNINLNEEAPHAGGGSISKDDERNLQRRIKDLELQNLKLNADLVAKKEAEKAPRKTAKKTGGKAKKVEEVAKTEDEKPSDRFTAALEPDLA